LVFSSGILPMAMPKITAKYTLKSFRLLNAYVLLAEKINF
jgi:hypothetical protein